LPEDFGPLDKGYFKTKVPEFNDSRIMLVVGLFQNTLYKFLGTFPFNYKNVIHLDADLYSSTLFVLTTLAPKLKRGDIMIFDEMGVATHEFRAFMDFVTSYNIRYKVLAETNNYFQVAIKIF
jgi:hypothetical protein